MNNCLNKRNSCANLNFENEPLVTYQVLSLICLLVVFFELLLPFAFLLLLVVMILTYSFYLTCFQNGEPKFCLLPIPLPIPSTSNPIRKQQNITA